MKKEFLPVEALNLPLQEALAYSPEQQEKIINTKAALDLIPTIACYVCLLKKEGVKPSFRLTTERKEGE